MSKRPNDIIERFHNLPNMPLQPVFPWFGEGFRYVDSRMSVYASREHWAIVIQVIIVNQNAPGIEAIANEFYVWDNKNNIGLKEAEYLQIASNGDEGEVFSLFDLNNNIKTIRIRDSIVPIPQSMEVYKRKNIEILGNGQILQYHLMRALTPEYRETFFLRDDEILHKLDLNIPKLLQLEEWRHPIVYEDTTLEYPSDCEVFKLIDKVIESLDPSLYKPTEKPNTHWSNWTINDAIL